MGWRKGRTAYDSACRPGLMRLRWPGVIEFSRHPTLSCHDCTIMEVRKVTIKNSLQARGMCVSQVTQAEN